MLYKTHSRLQFTYSPVYDKFDGVVSKLGMYISVHRCVYALRHDKEQELVEDNANGYFSTCKAMFSTILFIHNTKKRFSYTLSREYRVVRNRYSRLLFTSEDRLCANLRVQEQSTNMTSQCQCLAFAWRHNQLWWRHNVKSEKTVTSDSGEMIDKIR